MNVEYTLNHHNANPPERANESDAGFDLTAAEIIKDDSMHQWINTGVALAIPQGHVGLVFARSSITEKGLILHNGVGVIDSGYRGDIQVRLQRLYSNAEGYGIGDRCAQVVILPLTNITTMKLVDALDSTERGEGGFGSTGS